jgi:hypothetical protein
MKKELLQIDRRRRWLCHTGKPCAEEAFSAVKRLGLVFGRLWPLYLTKGTGMVSQ